MIPRSCPIILLGVWWTVVLGGGCADPNNQTPPPRIFSPPSSAEPVSSNIVGIRKYFSVSPWLSFSPDASGRVNGISFSVYLEDASRPKGVFGTGTIVIQMYRLDKDDKGRELPELVQEWQYDAQKAVAFRAKKETMLGWGYGFRLSWEPTLEVEGRQVAFVIKYVREDGRVVSSSRQVLEVPVHGEKK